MSPQDRDRIITAVELALGFPNRDPEVLKPTEGKDVDWLSPDASWEDLESELRALSATFKKVPEKSSFRKELSAILQEHAARMAIVWDHPLLEELDVKGILREKGIHIVGAANPQGFFGESGEADVGITAVEAIVLESGSIVVKTGPGMPRSASLLPPVHIAITRSSQRLKKIQDLVSLFRMWLKKEGRMPSAVHIISGPSRTADIELTLVLGAHGPRALYILALEDRTF